MAGDGEVDVKLIRRLAEMAGLALDQERAAELAPQVEAMRRDVAALAAVDLSDVEPLLVPGRLERRDGD